jgi:hypothetical protein
MHVATKYSRRIIGLMSGTSLDAIDVAMVKIEKHGLTAKVKLEHFRELPVSAEDPLRRARAVRSEEGPHRRHLPLRLHPRRSLRRRRAAHAQGDEGSRRRHVDLIASAGQTIWHDPELSIIEPGVDWIDGTLRRARRSPSDNRPSSPSAPASSPSAICACATSRRAVRARRSCRTSTGCCCATNRAGAASRTSAASATSRTSRRTRLG